MRWIKRIFGGLLLLLVVAVAGLAIAISYTAECAPFSSASASNGTSENTLMRAVLYNCYGGPDVVQLVETGVPVPDENQVVVKVEAAAVNPLDWHYMRGSPYLMRLSSGLAKPSEQALGRDFAGEVVAVGSDVTEFKVGDAVFGGGSGAFSEYAVANAKRSIYHKPDNISFAEAAAVPVAGLTAFQALISKGQLKAGQRVLINGASGGVGTFAVQIAKAAGAEVVGVCSARNAEMVRSLGADHVFDYKSENYTESGQQFDLIVDMIGNHSIGDNLKVLQDNGRMILVGGEKGNWIAPLKKPLAAAIKGNFVDQPLIALFASFNRADLKALAEMLEDRSVRPVIDRSYPLEEVRAALTYSESGRARGKIILLPNPGN